MLAVVDTGPLYAAADRADRWHERCVEVLSRPDLSLVVPTLVVAETAWMVERRLGPHAEARLLRSLPGLHVEPPTPQDWDRMAELVECYAKLQLGTVDASVLALAERLGTPVVVTLDRRHFGAVRPAHVEALRLLP